MKKSNFLKNSKELLSRSFNPAKCKTALKLAGSRVKLLRNKKETQVKQIKREIAQLLESGQDQTAKIRVEHVVREEKMMAAYDLIEIYCELIAARMQIIETQKICPNDLKEAITSVTFASLRCGDVPELKDVKKHFTEKYGKDFVSAAVELRPESGVSRLLVEKLSATAPDVQTKIKILSAIAEEHNVKWDPKSFEDKDSIPPSDLLKGPRTFEETKLHAEPPTTESRDVQAPQSDRKMRGSLSNVSRMDHKHTSAQTSGVNTEFHHEARAPGDERAQFFPGDSNSTHSDRRQRWNMEFKDATAAAQAAAESAELASMAARAAAELSSRDKFMRQFSIDLNSDIHVSEHGGPETYVNSKKTREQNLEERRNRSFQENSHDGMKEFGQSTSFKSRASMHDSSLDHAVQGVHGYSLKNSSQEVSRGEMNMHRESFKYANARPEKHDDGREERIRKQPDSDSRHSISNDVNIFADYEGQRFKSNAIEDPFLSSGKGGVYGETSRESSAVVFDKSDSDSDIRDFKMGHTYVDHEPRFRLQSSGPKSRNHLSVNPDSWTRRSSSGIGKPTQLVDASKVDDSVRVTFDESNESESDVDIDMNTSSHNRIEDSRDLPSKYSQSVRQSFNDKRVESDFDELKSDGRPSLDQPALNPGNSQMESNYIGKSSPEDGLVLSLGKLRGGFRHKGNNNPLPFLKSQNDTPSSFSKKSEVAPDTMSERKKTELTRDFHSGSNSDSSDELRKRSGQKPRQHTPKPGTEFKTKTSLASPNSDNSDSDEDPPKESLTRITHKTNGISRRTKALSFSSGNNSFSKTQFGSNFNNEMDGEPKTASSETPTRSKVGSRNYYIPEPRQQHPSSTKISSQSRNPEPPTSAKAASKPPNSSSWGIPDRQHSGKANSTTSQDSKKTWNSSAREETSSTRPSSEDPKAEATPTQRASHVHPKLPDYDTLVQTLRKNRS